MNTKRVLKNCSGKDVNSRNKNNKNVWHEKLGYITQEELDEYNKKNPDMYRYWTLQE